MPQEPDYQLLQEEVTFKTSRSGGKGGQNVNKVATKVELNFDIENSSILNNNQKKIVLEKLDNRITKEGVLQIVAQEERTQIKNKKIVLKRFKVLMQEAFYVPKKRKPTKVPRSVKEKRLRDKKRHSELKKLRNKKSE